MITWKDRIEQVKAAFGVKNNKQLEEQLGLSNGYINDLVGGIKNKNPSKIIVALEQKYKISPVWFYDESVGMFGNKQENTTRQESELIIALRKTEFDNENRFSEIETRLSALESLLKQESPAPAGTDGPLYGAEPDTGHGYTAESEPEYGEEEYERVPYVRDIAAGPPIDIDEDRSGAVTVPARLLRKGERYYAASIRGGSMAEAGIRDGDLVLIRCTDVPRDGAIQVVRYQDKSTLKLLRETEEKGWELHYRDGSGRVISCDSNDYETQGEFEAVLLPEAANIKDI